MEAKNIVTTHIHLGEKQWKIPIPINFLLAKSPRQLVFYWTVADDLQRIVGSCRRTNFDVSFNVVPGDSIFSVTDVGVRCIRTDYITRLQQREFDGVMWELSRSIEDIQAISYIRTCESEPNLHHQIHKMVDFCVYYRGQQVSLEGVYQITKGVLEINQQFLSLVSIHEGVTVRKLYVNYYHIISLGALVLYVYFVRSLKDVNEGWLSVKLALEQLVVKSRADNYSYKEMPQHLNDLEAANTVGFSDSIMNMFLSVCSRTYDFVSSIGEDLSFEVEFPPLREFNQVRVLAKLSSMTIAGVICMLAVFLVDFKPLEHMKKDTTLNSPLQHLFKFLNDKGEYFIDDGIHIKKMLCNCEFHISDFYGNGILLQQLMIKLNRSSCFTKENEEEMISVIDKLERNIHKVSLVIQDMSSHADQYSQDICKISKLYGNEILLQQLWNKMSRSSCFNKENEEEMMSVIDKLQQNICKVLPYSPSTKTVVSRSPSYDVFMSFRGKDTDMVFTSHLYKVLILDGIRTYKDDMRPEIGRPIRSEILEAIESSRIAIVIISKGFATSTRCLEGIAKIVDCMEQGKLLVIPIFHDVDPSDVRHQSNYFEEGFANHETNPEITPEKVKTWRSAFSKVGDLKNGYHIKSYRSEIEPVNEIVSNISRLMSRVDVEYKQWRN